MLGDLGLDPDRWWGPHAGTVAAVLSSAAEVAADAARVRVEAARAFLAVQYGQVPETVRSGPLRARERRMVEEDEEPAQCPVCGTHRLAGGEHRVLWGGVTEYDVQSGEPMFEGEVRFAAQKFDRPVCTLRLASPAELDAAGVPTEWQVDDADPYDHADPPEAGIDDDAMYDAWRDMQLDRSQEP